MLNNCGKLRINENQNDDKNHTHTGYIIIKGDEFRLKGWIKTDKEGKEYIHIAAFDYNKF